MNWILLGVVGAVGLWAMTAYNRLVGLRNRSENAWSDIDVQLKRRHDLVPNLVETVKGYASHERTTFEEVTAARTQAVAARTLKQRSAAEGALSRTLGSLFAVAEAYPELRANESFTSLQGELSSLEERPQNARRYYNAVVRDLNTACETVPSSFIANAFGFQRADYFELDALAERSAPAVSFGS